jgi:hypothetical protein
MFKILAGDYGNPPKDSELFGELIIITQSDDVKVSNFNNQQVSGTDYISLTRDIVKVKLLSKEDLGKAKDTAAFYAVTGFLLAGPLGLAGGFLAGNKNEFILLVETRVGNKFILKTDKKVYRKILDKSKCPEFELEDSVEEEKINEGTDLAKELEKLGALKEKGLLTDEEFSAAKAKLLS